MLSVIVYGRNDTYGYNLHKRAALSLNNFGHLLGNEDEILFVDYNTPAGFPTFPEAIADTLNSRTKRLLRVLRVTESQHQLMAPPTHLKTLEPLARNVALRRSNPNNRWVLSTNTDMVFVPRLQASLSESLAALPDGHYGLPRFELPEGLWEELERTKPSRVLASLSEWAISFHLNQVAESWLPHRFDGPGDFQLILRQDLFDVNGFDERMSLGWHVDSNISKRISLSRGNTGDLSDILLGFHCDHTRQETPAHASGAPQNSTFKYIDSVTKSAAKSQKNWGLKGVEVEELHLDQSFSRRLVEALQETIPAQKGAPSPRRYNASGYDVDPPHDATVVTFLLDLVGSHGSRPRILWIGPPSAIAALSLSGLKKLGKSLDFQIYSPAGLLYRRKELGSVPSLEGFDFVIFDLRAFWAGVPDAHGRRHTETLSVLRRWWWCQPVRNGLSAKAHIVAIDAINTSVETEFNMWTKCGRTPYSIGISHGVLREKEVALVGFFLRKIVRRRTSALRRAVIGDENVSTWISKVLRLRTMSSARRIGLFEDV
jgi:hypothetical protein